MLAISRNESTQANELKREFQQEEAKKVIVSDLTYVKVKSKWHYVCIFVDLFNREIIGFSTGPNKDAGLVARAFFSIKGDLRDIELFHSARKAVHMTMSWRKPHLKSSKQSL